MNIQKNISSKYFIGVIGVLLLIIAYLLGRQQGIVAGTNVATNITNSPTPTINTLPTSNPTNIHTVTPQSEKTLIFQAQPSDKALKVAGVIYTLYKDVQKRDKIRQKAGIPKSNENTEIIQLALWFDKNMGYLAKVEAAIEEYRLQESKNPAVLPPAESNLLPLHCTSTTIGSSTYTNCY